MADIDRQKLAEAVKANSSLSLDQIEAMFGRACAENRQSIWNFLTMQRFQQESIWQGRCVLKSSIAPDVIFTRVDRLPEGVE